MKPIHIKNIKALLFAVVISLSGSNASAQNSIDKDIKKNISSIENATASLIQLEPKKFEYDINRYKQLNLPQGTQYGFLAENVETILPELVNKKKLLYVYGKKSTKEGALQKVDNNSPTPFLVASIKELYEEIEKLKAEIELLKKK